jgi:hypothetical protein
VLCLIRPWFQIFPSLANKTVVMVHVVDCGVKNCKEYSILLSVHPQNSKHLWQDPRTSVWTRSMNVWKRNFCTLRLWKSSQIALIFTTSPNSWLQ